MATNGGQGLTPGLQTYPSGMAMAGPVYPPDFDYFEYRERDYPLDPFEGSPDKWRDDLLNLNEEKRTHQIL